MPRKWSYDHVVFVLSHGKAYTASQIAERFNARFSGVEIDAEQAKYIRHRYKNNPAYSGAASNIATPTSTSQALTAGTAGPSNITAQTTGKELADANYGREVDDGDGPGTDAGTFPAQDQPLLYNPVLPQPSVFEQHPQGSFRQAAIQQPAISQGPGYQFLTGYQTPTGHHDPTDRHDPTGYQPPLHDLTPNQVPGQMTDYPDFHGNTVNALLHPDAQCTGTGEQPPGALAGQTLQPAVAAQPMLWEEWYEGPHANCQLPGTHRHDSAGGVYFASVDALYNTIFAMKSAFD
ncbi:hypothetical protein GE09DRAFT_1052429 [Coniochaeta sp. 2T2.1]|nr:hypothetical protein GE09DRAFT_1052429 [Coniochaeta sp. 2T2.1]